MDRVKVQNEVSKLIDGAEPMELTNRRVGVHIGTTFELSDPRTKEKRWRKVVAMYEADIPDGADIGQGYAIVTATAALQAATIEGMMKEEKL